jgi:predicted nucleotidyltransferase
MVNDGSEPVSENNLFPAARHVREIVRTLDKAQPAAIYLFGSAARGRIHALSDIDLAFLPSHPTDPVEVFELSNQLADTLQRDVDLVDLSRASTVMAKEVFRSGTILAENDPMRRREFEMRTLADYARLAEHRLPVLVKVRPHRND